VLEATFYFDVMTSEVIVDTKHLSPDLLKYAYKFMGPDRLALCTDTSRAMDMPDGEYIFGPKAYGEPIVKKGGVGLMNNCTDLASGVVGMDFALRTFLQATNAPLVDAVRMASLTPARIAGLDAQTGSLHVGKWADLLIMDRNLHVQQVYVGGKRVY
jgi:N-acetylglucosamine-6-phosphate deacetylase